jgi:hypothetical protein
LNIVRTAFLALGSMLSLLLIVVGVVGYLLTGPAPVPWSTAPETWSWYEARALDHKVEEFQQRVAEGSARDSVTLTLLEDEVNSKLNELASHERLPLEMRDICIYFDDGLVKGSATVNLLIDVQVATEARMAIRDGKPVISIESLHLGRLPIPKTLTDNVIAALMGQADTRLESLAIELTKVVVGEGWIIIGGEVKEAPSEA